jgi:hypothetical protein
MKLPKATGVRGRLNGRSTAFSTSVYYQAGDKLQIRHYYLVLLQSLAIHIQGNAVYR